MAFSFANLETWKRWNKLADAVWNANDLGADEWRELNSLMSYSDWGAHIPERDRSHARRMIAHAQAAMTRKLGMENPTNNYRL